MPPPLGTGMPPSWIAQPITCVMKPATACSGPRPVCSTHGASNPRAASDANVASSQSRALVSVAPLNDEEAAPTQPAVGLVRQPDALRRPQLGREHTEAQVRGAHELLELALPGRAVAGGEALELRDVLLERGRQERGRAVGEERRRRMLGVEVLEPVAREVVGQLGVRRRADEERVPRRQHLVRETGLGEVVDGADRTAQPVASLEHRDAPSSTREQCRRGQRVDPRTHENCVGASHAPERTTRPGFVYMIKRMLPREVAYARPGTVDEAVRLLGAHDGARALAGGQTLVSVMKQRAAAPEVLVDLADLAELRSLSRSTDGASLEIGPMVTYSELIRSPEIAAGRPALGAAARTIADVQVQNRGTIGGNVCLADPTNHFPPLLTALGATFTIRGAAASARSRQTSSSSACTGRRWARASS